MLAQTPPTQEPQMAEINPMVPVSALRAIAVEAIRSVTGCPDVSGNGKHLTDEIEAVARAAAQSLRTTSQPVGVPEGWKLVPIKCTEAMKDVGYPFEFSTISDGRLLAQSMWNELLTASPTPPAAQGVPDADDLAQFIRQIDGNHKMGAGALAERIVEWLSAAPTAAGDGAAQDLIAKRAARWDWVAQFLSVDDVGDEKSMYSLVLNADGLEDAAWRARMLDVLEFTSDGTDTSIESFVDAAIAAQSAEAGKVGG